MSYAAELKKWIEEECKKRELVCDAIVRYQCKFWLSGFVRLLEKESEQYSTVGDHRGVAQAFDDLTKRFGLETKNES